MIPLAVLSTLDGVPHLITPAALTSPQDGTITAVLSRWTGTQFWERRESSEDSLLVTRWKVCELLVQETRVGGDRDEMTTLNIMYYFNKDWIKNDTKFELLTARPRVHFLIEISYKHK